MAGTSSVAQRKPMDSFPWVTSMASWMMQGSAGAATARGGSGSWPAPRGRAAKASSRASSTREMGALPQ